MQIFFVCDKLTKSKFKTTKFYEVKRLQRANYKGSRKTEFCGIMCAIAHKLSFAEQNDKKARTQKKLTGTP